MAARGGKSLRRRMVQGLVAYAVLVSIAVYAYGWIINERAEQLVWTSLLEAEFNHIEGRQALSAGERWADTETMLLFGDEPGSPLPAALEGMAPGLHDEVVFDGKEWAVLIREIDGQPWALALDIGDFERHEAYVAASVLGAMLVMVVLLGLAIGWGVDRLMRPMRLFAQAIAGLRPDRSGERIELPPDASAELAVIADALNDYIARNELYVQRERVFIDSMSHELRTPIAVIGGAAELAGAQPGVPEGARQQIARISRTGREIERLIALLLVLAKDPGRLAQASDRIDLAQLLPEIIDDHLPMARDKGLVVALEALLPCEILAPLPVVQAAIGNLLRNAIENSDSGRIDIRVEAGAVVIEDPGHGMTPEEISAIYARMARGGGGRERGGIGLDLISRLCEHLGWTLAISSRPGQGTTTRLDLSSARTGAGA
ncbi:HAMP domain-containing sensor histidine kinase [Luteimonas sp. MC1750]|uniref:sensor histidine kinase n=1 Tax=Luteimonas sp. MC1750 TaxID=2799326 RepID=UPI0018F0FA6B|nr:HAMP domain-containing sensor histidine kinase [Luteimonas sp. MC1750]MBJ6983352.1 HAMP domain-containing histidine kinase [Luteimonas sp. MC1750]QQO06212.1 HAMP domain-containing histidine kinase [Luteimonas sp. MC1750]